MRPRNEPNLKQLDPRLGELRLEAGRRAGAWVVCDRKVTTSDGQEVCKAESASMAHYLRALHQHFLPVLNQLLYRLRSCADLEKE